MTRSQPLNAGRKYRVILFQSYLRGFVLNFGRLLKNFEFVNVAKQPVSRVTYQNLPSFEQEIAREKSLPLSQFRRLIGLPNFRWRFQKDADLFLTYGCLLITNKPYFTYIETGLALYNYDPTIARNPLARLIVAWLATRSNCRQLIFVSQAARKSFFATVDYPAWAKQRLEAKSVVVYPVPIEKQLAKPRNYQGQLKLLFAGLYYIKGGVELVKAFERLHKAHPNISLTMLTSFHVLKKSDLAHLQKVPGLNLVDAKLKEAEMIELYRSHDIFVLPTYRDGFGLVLVEALAYGMPLIVTDQYATNEMAIDGYNGFVYPNHPLKDYDPDTYRMFGRYYHPKAFYTDLFRFQKQGKFKPIEDWLVKSVEQFVTDPALLEKFSRQSIQLYRDKFDSQKVSQQLETLLSRAIESSGKNKI